MHASRAHLFTTRHRFASCLQCVTKAPVSTTTGSSMQQQQQQRQSQQQQGQGGGSGNRRRRGGNKDSKGPGYAAPSAATPGHLGGGRPQQQRQAPAQGNPHNQHQHNMQHTPTHQHQQVHPMPHPREPHINRGQMPQHVQQHQQQHGAGHQHRAQDNGVPSNTSALSGVMFSSLNLHPSTLSGLHVSPFAKQPYALALTSRALLSVFGQQNEPPCTVDIGDGTQRAKAAVCTGLQSAW